ncbi:Hsp70 chaperone protein [Fusarium tjaetaba]|uniref:Hsp70 chaperone protein n=1 Tax=Fusarium tjaetaba TaxID=1567544 RepID=A0A8H5R484_9HYPO|nr:Hsp70 chaperone protein [Fusarium tjaetaba]KAF5626264.1 Hsp70 chaperone protein [Fusarium tjaetaba]
MTANQPQGDAIIIGIDFGTTFSGVAWAYSGQPDEIEIVTSWDSQLNHCSDVEKAPTQLLYDEKGQGVKWGYGHPVEVAASTQLQEAHRLKNKVMKDPIEIIATFLRNLWVHSTDSIKRTLGAGLVRRCKLQVVITLPAIWPPYAQRRMKQAAQQSGILDARSAGTTSLHFISEPEAAAPATIKDLSKRSIIKAGDTIVVCDAGGGTVDLISYVFESTDPFVVKECVKGDGGLCGGVFLDEAFIKLIKNKVPKGTWNFVGHSDEKKFLNDQWEHGIKPQFENQPRTWPVDLPESCSSDLSTGLKRRATLDLTSDEISSVFCPIADKIETLVSRQVDAIQTKYHKEPKYIVLVGGFGRSRYLFNRLEERFGEDTILQSRGTKPWTAICRGAVVQGLLRHDPSLSVGLNVEARVARMSYGVKYSTPFIVGKHKKVDKYWDEDEQQHKAGSAVQTSNTIYCTATFPPPARAPKGLASVQELCTVTWNKTINARKLPKWANRQGQTFSKLNYRIEMDCEDGTVNFKIIHKGARVGEQNFEV